MAISSRGVKALSLGFVAVVGVAGYSLAQAPAGDGVQRTATSGTTPTAAAPKTSVAPAVVGSIDLEAVFRGSEKAKFQSQQLNAEMAAKQGEQTRLIADAKEIQKQMESLTPGTADFKTREGKLVEIKAKLQANKENAEREGQVRYAEIMASFYGDAQNMVRRVAAKYGMTYVVRVNNEPLSPQDPESVMQRISSQVVYASPETDITKMVLFHLNNDYVKAGGQVAKSSTPGEAELNAPSQAPAPAPAPTQAPDPRSAARPPARTPR